MKTKICPLCGKPVTGHGLRKYCTDCRPPYSKKSFFAKINFEVEWARWKKDFAAGKTVSNL